MSEIKDSGNRTEFSTGAVRDIQEDKGRFDLAPIGVIARFYPMEARSVLDRINLFMETGNTEPLLEAIKCFFDDRSITESKRIALAKWNSNFENEALQYKCKSLATIYNYFKLDKNRVHISSADDVWKFLNDENIYSIEHFIVNNSGTVTYVDGIEDYTLPDETKKFSTYIFNFIFLPKDINNTILKNYSPRRKTNNLTSSGYQTKINCEYSKMIIHIVEKMFPDEVIVTDLNENEKAELEKYWLVSFRHEYSKYTSVVIDKIAEHFKQSLTGDKND